MTTGTSTALQMSADTAFAHDRLSYVLPDFTRISWVSDRARATWEPRIQRIGAAWADMEWQSVASGIRRCALTSVPADQLIERTAAWAVNGLSTMPVALSGAAPGYASTSVAPRSGEPFEYRVAIGALPEVAALKRAIDTGDDATMGELLGFPSCCIDFFRRVWVDSACVDTTWAMAANSRHILDDSRTIEISEATPFQANIMWRWMGVRAVPHLPCAFDCTPTVEFAKVLSALGRRLGYGSEMDWTEEILSWPVSWSALHGVAELKTPVLKASTRTDATGHAFVVRRHGARMPPEAVAGLSFPFKTPDRPGITHSLAFRKGLEAPIAIEKPLPEWYSSDNGFSTRAAMDEAHRPIVELAQQTLATAGGAILDLGCGNGALLKKIVERTTDRLPFGLDIDTAKLDHARQLQPAFADNFIAGSMFDIIPLDEDTVYSLIVLMPGRLLEVDTEPSARLRTWLRGHFRHLLVYAYGEWLTRHRDLEGLTARAGLRLVSVHPSGAAGLAEIVD